MLPRVWWVDLETTEQREKALTWDGSYVVRCCGRLRCRSRSCEGRGLRSGLVDSALWTWVRHGSCCCVAEGRACVSRSAAGRLGN